MGKKGAATTPVRAAIKAASFGVLFAVAAVLSAHALPGDLDRRFHRDGKKIHKGLPLRQPTLLVLPNRRLTMIGSVGGCQGGWMTRFERDGKVDKDFFYRPWWSITDDEYSGVDLEPYNKRVWPRDAVLQRGNYVVVGRWHGPPCSPGYNPSQETGTYIARHLRNGQPDVTFGPNWDGSPGIVYPRFGSEDNHVDLQGVAKQRDGKILVTGRASMNGAVVARFNADGTLDTDADADPETHFAHEGWTSLPAWEGVKAAVQSDGRILVLGRRRSPEGDYDVVLTRLLSNGSLDASFGEEGTVILDFRSDYESPYTPDDWAQSLALTRDRIFIGGETSGALEPGDWFVTAVHRTNGHIDETFGNSGTSFIDMGTQSNELSDNLESLVVQPDGKVIAAGWTRWGEFDDDPTSSDGDHYFDRAAVARLTSNGQLDETFGDGGRRMLLNRHSYAWSIKLDDRNRLLVAGSLARQKDEKWTRHTYLVRIRTGL